MLEKEGWEDSIRPYKYCNHRLTNFLLAIDGRKNQRRREEGEEGCCPVDPGSIDFSVNPA